MRSWSKFEEALENNYIFTVNVISNISSVLSLFDDGSVNRNNVIQRHNHTLYFGRKDFILKKI